MYATDFIYDNYYLSDFNFIICDFDYSTGAIIKDAGSKITFNKISRHRGKIQSLSSTRYDSCLISTFDICKNPEIYEFGNRSISNEEYRQLVRWLNRKTFLQLRFIGQRYNYDNYYYKASFNIDKIFVNDELCGIRLTMETDKPFGYGDPVNYTLTYSAANTTKTIEDISDEIGSIYPDIVITLSASGNLTLSNDIENCSMVINNCTSGEVITINGDTQIITSSLNSHNILNDFNFTFLSIGNTYTNRINSITSSLPCSVVISYSPIIKDSPD